MATLTGKTIKDTYKSLIKINDNEELAASLQELTDGNGNGSGISINTAGDLKATGTLEFGSLKDTGENITIAKFVDEADGIASNDNDTSIPTSAAIVDYVAAQITLEDLDFTGDTGTGSVDLDSQALNLVGANGVVTSASGQTITIDTSSLDTRLTTAEADIDTNTAAISTEEAARIAADTTLQSNIDSEEASRISADNTLQANINTEATTRATADTTLQSNIDAEAATRLSNDTTLQSNIDTEESARISADSTLQSNIDTEASTRLANDTTLQGNIDSEETARIAADSALQSQITSNDGDITALDGRLTTAEGNISSNDTDISNLQSSKQDISEKGQANGYAPLDSGAKISESYLPDSIVGQVEYQGTWNASTNTPTLPAASGVKGHYYVTSVAGTYLTIDYAVGDWVISNGTAWEKVDNTDAVTTVFGRLGAIVANESDYSSFYPLISDLDAEETARISGDAALQGQIDTNDTDITNLQNDKYDKTGGTISGSAAITGDLTVDTNTLYVDSTNNRVGIGTVSPNVKLMVIESGTSTASTLSLIGTNTSGAASQVSHISSYQPSGGSSQEAALDFKVRSSTDSYASPSTVMTLLGTGNVGIGTSTIKGKLHSWQGDSGQTIVNGAANGLVIEDNANNGISILTPSTATGSIFFGDEADNFIGGFRYDHTDDSLATYVNNSERLRIDSSGNVGIGTSSPSGKLDVAGVSGTWRIEPAGVRMSFDNASGGYIRTEQAVPLVFETNGSTERMRIDSSGNVGIGTTSPATPINIQASNAAMASNGIMLIQANSAATNNGGQITFGTSSSRHAAIAGRQETASGTAGYLQFGTRASTGDITERMRITSGGDVLIGTTGEPNGTSNYGSAFIALSSNRMALKLASSSSVNTELAAFYNPNGKVGSITTNGSATAYNTSSDYRLKENVVELTGALDRVDALNPRRFNFIADPDKTVDGFLAHEVADVVPEAITGKKDEVDDEGNAVYQGIDQSKLVPLLVGAIQELRAEIEILKSQINP